MSQPKPKHAVIVDDEKSYTDLLADILGEYLGCPVATFTRPALALHALESIEPGIIVTDYYMPEIDGLQFLRRATKLKPDVPCIMITGHSEALESLDLSDITSLKSILAKPFSARVLAETILTHWPEARRRD